MSFIYVPSTPAASIAIGTPVDTTSGTSVTFTAIPLTSKIVYVNFVDFSLSGADSILIQLGTSTAIDTTGYAYSSVAFNAASSSTGASTSTSAFFWQITAGATLNGTINLSLENSTTNTYNMAFIWGTSVARTGIASGRKVLASPLSQIKISMFGATTFSTGQINIAYI